MPSWSFDFPSEIKVEGVTVHFKMRAHLWWDWIFPQ